MSASCLVEAAPSPLTGVGDYAVAMRRRSVLCEQAQLRRRSGSDLATFAAFQYKSKSVVDLTAAGCFPTASPAADHQSTGGAARDPEMTARVFRALCGSIGNLNVLELQQQRRQQLASGGGQQQSPSSISVQQQQQPASSATMIDRDRQRSHSLGRMFEQSILTVSCASKPTVDHVYDTPSSCRNNNNEGQGQSRQSPRPCWTATHASSDKKDSVSASASLSNSNGCQRLGGPLANGSDVSTVSHATLSSHPTPNEENGSHQTSSFCCTCNKNYNASAAKLNSTSTAASVRPASSSACCVAPNYANCEPVMRVRDDVVNNREPQPLRETSNSTVIVESANMDYCHIWNASSEAPATTAVAPVQCRESTPTQAPALPPKQRASMGSFRRLYAVADNFKLVSQSLDQLNTIEPAGAVLKSQPADCCGSVATVGGAGGVPPIPPPPRPLRKPSASSSCLPKPYITGTLPKQRSSTQLTGNCSSSLSSSLHRAQSMPSKHLQAGGSAGDIPPLLPRKTRQRLLPSVQECEQHDNVDSATPASRVTQGQGRVKKPPLTITIEQDPADSEPGVTRSQPVTRSGGHPASVSPNAGSDVTNEASKVASPAASVLRPRFGKEYTVPDRKRLVEEFGSRLSSRASIGTMFTFDIPALIAASAASSGTNSPQSPSNVGGRASTNVTPPLPAYLLSQRFAASEFGSLPGSPRTFAQESPPQPPLNYIQLDYSGVADARLAVPRPASTIGSTGVGAKKPSDGVDYAIIDMVATTVASRVGREHVKQREESLRARLQQDEGGRDRAHHQLTPSESSPRSKMSKNSSHSSLLGGSKDRKHSLVSRDSRSSADQRR